MRTNALLGCILAQGMCLYAVAANSAADPAAAIAECRAKHAEHPPEHIACLERELNARGAANQKVVPPSLGAEQLRTERTQETVEQVTVQIESATYSFDGKGLFRMTDGQVWKGTESTPPEQRLKPGTSYAARIERGKLGGYRMYVDGVSRMIKVMRTN